MSVKLGRKVFIVAGNTHLYFHSQASAVRLFQVKVLHDMVVAAQKHLEATYRDCLVIKLIGGDLNALPSNGTISFLGGQTIPKNFIEWYSLGKEQYIGTMTLEPQFQLKS